MNKKLITLILLLPLVLMISLYSAINTVTINVKVPVSKIQLNSEPFVSLNLDKEERYYVDYTIYPTTAKNKQVTMSVEPIANQPLASVEYKNGYLYPISAGYANVCFTTVDGGYKAKFQVVVKSTMLKEIDCIVEKNILTIGESVQINTEFKPATATDKSLEYLTSNSNVVKVNDKGLITAVGKGSATITIRSTVNQNVFDTIDVLVNADKLLSVEKNEDIISSQYGSINLTIDTVEDYNINYQILDENGNQLSNVLEPKNQNAFTDNGNGNYQFDYQFLNADYYGVAVIKFILTTPTQMVSESCKITRIQDFVAQFSVENDLYVKLEDRVDWKNYITITPSDVNVEYNINYSNDNLSSLSTTFKPNKIGVTKATITVTNKENANQVVTLEKDVYCIPTNLFINESVKSDGNSYGIEDVWTIGRHTINNISHKLTLSFGKTDVQGVGYETIIDKIAFNSSDETKVKVEKNGEINILEDTCNQIVEISASLDIPTQSLSVLNEPSKIQSQPFKVRCVGEGYEVDNFIDLYNNVKENRIVILQGDIVNDFGKNKDNSNFYVGNNIQKIKSTYDTKFYGDETPEVVTLLQFKNDLYGNGYTINANNVTSDDSLDRLFKGPLNFVAMGDIASVKAQDNICFAVFENVTINNVELLGRSLEESQGNFDLTDLDYAGTVLEVLGDNVTIEYCRISNGRTVLRAFGDAYDKDKTINVLVKNSVLSRAREFIVRIGSNKIEFDNRNADSELLKNYTAPSLLGSERFNYPVMQNYSSFTSEEKQDYEEKFIKTFFTIENSVLEDSGLFCIGLDTHFAGPMLLDANKTMGYNEGNPLYQSLSKWKNLSGTSYGAKLTLNGDVRMYNWKEIDNFDSSTLIEVNENSTLGNYSDLLKLDVKEMITNLDNTSMVYTDNTGKKYAHGGIVLFGGGKNYCVVENNCKYITGLEELGELSFEEYSITLKEVDKEFLEKAAGNNAFYFVLYGANSKFIPPSQENILKSDKAYNCIYLID